MAATPVNKQSGITVSLRDLSDGHQTGTAQRELMFGDVLVGVKSKRVYLVDRNDKRPFVLLDRGRYGHLTKNYVIKKEGNFVRVTNLADASDMLKLAAKDVFNTQVRKKKK